VIWDSEDKARCIALFCSARVSGPKKLMRAHERLHLIETALNSDILKACNSACPVPSGLRLICCTVHRRLHQPTC
jgi:hypothetical protein